MIHTLEHTSSISLDRFLKPSHFFSKIQVGINIKKVRIIVRHQKWPFIRIIVRQSIVVCKSINLQTLKSRLKS